MSPREKELTVWRISYLIYQTIVYYIRTPDIGLVILELDSEETAAYPTNMNYLKTVHDLKTKIRE